MQVSFFMTACTPHLSFFFFNDTATTEIYTLSLHDALPISLARDEAVGQARQLFLPRRVVHVDQHQADRKSTRLNSSHSQISYAVFCLKKKKTAKHDKFVPRQPAASMCLMNLYLPHSISTPV